MKENKGVNKMVQIIHLLKSPDFWVYCFNIGALILIITLLIKERKTRKEFRNILTEQKDFTPEQIETIIETLKKISI